MKTTAEQPPAGTDGVSDNFCWFLLIVLIRVGPMCHRNPVLACMCMFVRKCQRIVCVYFLNKYRCMLRLAFHSSVMDFIVCLCVGDRPLGHRLT